MTNVTVKSKLTDLGSTHCRRALFLSFPLRPCGQGLSILAIPPKSQQCKMSRTYVGFFFGSDRQQRLWQLEFENERLVCVTYFHDSYQLHCKQFWFLLWTESSLAEEREYSGGIAVFIFHH